jgi:ABC-type transport system involved in multi-copper enzyme maturation permease subunit
MAGVRLFGGTVAVAVVAAVWCLTVGLSIQMLVPPDLEIAPMMPVWMAAPAFLYLTLMYGIGIAAGAAAKDGISAIVMAFAVWMATLFVVPQINELITQSLVDVPPQSRMEAERRDNMADSARLLEQEIGAAVSRRWPDVSRVPDELQLSIYRSAGEPVWRAGVIRIRDAAALEERQWVEQRARADRLKGWLDSVNPNAWLVETMAELAGTGRTAASAWTLAVASHQRALDEALFLNRPRITARVLWKEQPLILAYDRHRPPLYSALPSFVAPQAQSGIWTPAAARSFAGLTIYALLAMAAAYFWLWSRLR